MIARIAHAPVLSSGALPRSAKIAIGLLAFLGLTALPSGWALLTPAPGQTPLGMPLEWLANTPFTSYFIPGLLLFGLFGVGSLVSVALGLGHHWLAPYAAFMIGGGHVIWITVQYAMLRDLGMHPLQPTMFICGSLIALAAFAWWRVTRPV